MKSLVAALAALFLACGGEKIYEARGVVREVQPEIRQVVIEHGDIPGLMPAMTMNFDVDDPALLARAAKGQAVSFRLSFDGKRYRIVALDPLGEGDAAGPGGPSLANLAASRDPAPDFRLVDQVGNALALADLRGKAVVLDFIFTTCPGPCPILTGILSDTQKRLPAELRARTRFVSVTLDPARDTPPVLLEYARKRGLDLSDWSLLTGPIADVEGVVRSYGVGAARAPDGTIDHLVATFLIDPEGRIAERYIGLNHTPEDIQTDLARLLS